MKKKKFLYFFFLIILICSFAFGGCSLMDQVIQEKGEGSQAESSAAESLPEQESSTEELPPAAVYEDRFIASAGPFALIYLPNDQGQYVACGELRRGVSVAACTESVTEAATNAEYVSIIYENDEFYVPADNLVTSDQELVQEKTVYVRTPATVYAEPDRPRIAFSAAKASSLEVLSFDRLEEDGTVHMYQVRSEAGEGWIYGKYTVLTEEDALASYDALYLSGIHASHEFDYDLHSGHAGDLDYFPVQKQLFDGNPLCVEAKAMYLCKEAVPYIESYAETAVSAGVNCIILDLKDGQLTYPAEAARTYCPTGYDTAYTSESDLKHAVDVLKEAGLYVVGRIVVFNDPDYASDHPEECIYSPGFEGEWVSAFSRNCWQYNVELALEACDKFEFNEIQFDYIRFPDYSYEMSEDPQTDWKNTYSEEKSAAIQGFCYYACDMVHQKNTYVSADVFGDAANDCVTPQGQYWPAISNIVDVISAMPYVDHFDHETDIWSYPYNTVYNWAQKAAARQTEIPTPAIARTWVTGYDVPYWDPYTILDSGKLSDQVWALYDAELPGGFIPWNAGSSLSKYQSWTDAWKTEYTRNEAFAAYEPSEEALGALRLYDGVSLPSGSASSNSSAESTAPGGSAESSQENSSGKHEASSKHDAPDPSTPVPKPESSAAESSRPHESSVSDSHEESLPETEHIEESVPDPSGYEVYTVESGDTYFDILIEHYDYFDSALMTAFCSYNHQSPDSLLPGTELILPPLSELLQQ